MNPTQHDPWAQEPPEIAVNETEGHAGDSIARSAAPASPIPEVIRGPLSAPEWRFQRSPKGDDLDDPTESEFFTGEGLARALVRESIQNALDAAISDERPVCVRFRLGRTPGSSIPAWLKNDLPDHLDASDDTRDITNDDCPWLLVEDFNCVGLSGEPEEDEPTNVDSRKGKNNYFYFWRNVGRTDKTADERGSWGIGKAVFQSASRAKSFYGVTVRDEDGRTLLRGKSVLKTHHVDSQRFRARGNFGQFSEDEENFALPITDKDMIDEFCELFDAHRRGRSGFSVLVPWLDEDVDDWTVDTLGRYVCEQYFMPVVAGQLIVEITDGDKVLSIEREDIQGVINDELHGLYPADKLMMSRMVDFARWSATLPRERFTLVHAPSSNNWGDVEIPEEQIENARENFDRGEPIAFRCSCNIHPKLGGPQTVWFSVFLQRDKDLKKPVVSYVRRGITIPDVRSEAIGDVRALVSVNWPLLGRLLGDAENPAHTDWTPRKSRVEVKWNKPEAAIRFVRLSVREIIGRLQAPSEEPDEELFADLFSFLEPDDEPKQPKKSGGGKQTAPPIINVPPPVRVLRVDRRSDGFVVQAMPDLATGDQVKLRTAYAIRKGNPFKKWDPRDFDLAQLSPRIEGSADSVVDGNSLVVTVADRDNFSIEITGFDPHRDLVVDARRVTAEQ